MSRSAQGYFARFENYQPVDGEEVRVEANFVGADYFTTLGIPLLSGRDFSARDREEAMQIAVVNQTIVERYFGGQDPTGQQLNIIGWEVDMTIVGVAPDVNHALRDDQGPFVYFPLQQHANRAVRRSAYVLVATPVDASNSLASIRSVVRSLDSRLPVSNLTTMTNRKAEFMMPQRMGALLLSALGGLTALLTVIGIFGVVSYIIARRRREIGIRLALGAERSGVVRMITAGASRPILIGIATGIVSSFGMSRLIAAFMYDIATTDLATYGVITMGLNLVTIGAAYLPATRATRIDPTESLRAE